MPTVPENFLPCHYCGQKPEEQGRDMHAVSRDETGKLIACCLSPKCLAENTNKKAIALATTSNPTMVKQQVAKWRFGVDRIDAVALREVFEQHGDELLLERDGDYITLFVHVTPPPASPEEREEQGAKVCSVCGAHGTFYISRGGGQPGNVYYCQTPGCKNYDRPV